MPQPTKLRALVVCICALAGAFLLEGCREEEQGRVLSFEKGKYLGKPDQKLTSAQVEALRFRAANQQQQ